MGTITTSAFNGNTAWDNLGSDGSRSLNVMKLTKPLNLDTTSLVFVAGNKSFVSYYVSMGKCTRSGGNLPPSPCPDPTFSDSTWKGKACKAGTTTCTQSGITTTTTIYMTDSEGLLASRSKSSIAGQQLVTEIDYSNQSVAANANSLFNLPSTCPSSSGLSQVAHGTGLAHHIASIHALVH